MNARFGWAMAVVAVVLGWWFWRWQGVALAVSGTVFWLLLQFTRALRAMRQAGQAPVGSVPSAVMLHARLNKGQRLLDLIQLTRSLGEKRSEQPETWAWHDASGAEVVVTLEAGRVTGWTLQRPPEGAAADSAAAPSA